MVWKLELNGGKMTKKDQKLLAFLIAVVIVVIAGWYILRPLVNQIKSDREQIVIEEEQKVINDNKIKMLPSQRNLVEINEEKFKSMTSDYFPYMESNEIGKYLTNMSLDYGLDVLSMNIKMPEAEEFVTPFAERASKTPVQSEDGGSDITKVPVFMISKVSTELQGDKDVLQNLLDHLIYEEGSILVTGYSWGERAVNIEGELVKLTTLQVSTNLLMVKEETNIAE